MDIFNMGVYGKNFWKPNLVHKKDITQVRGSQNRILPVFSFNFFFEL